MFFFLDDDDVLFPVLVTDMLRHKLLLHSCDMLLEKVFPSPCFSVHVSSIREFSCCESNYSPLVPLTDRYGRLKLSPTFYGNFLT